ncbi:hypothetical protein ELO08_28945, partial [Klebsiella pneumoniae]|nr:hypothetical protein [Klebsiella pneumoniae]
SAQIREILISESAWEEMTCLFAPSLAEDLLPVTCPTCRVIWYHTHEFTLDDFDSLSGKGDFVVTDLKELNI